MLHKNKGFTLIETIIALLIVSISLGTLIGNYEKNTHYLSYVKDKTLSELLINNLIVERRLGPKLTLGHSNDSVEFGYKDWYWNSNVSIFEIIAAKETETEAEEEAEEEVFKEEEDEEDIIRFLQVDLQLFASKADQTNKKPIQSQKFYVRP